MHPSILPFPNVRHLAALAALALGGPLAAQEGPPPLPQLETPAQKDAREEMLELFARVETRLAEIDDLLYDASAGEAALAGVEGAGIDDVLRHSIQRGEEALLDIDRILEIACQQSSSSSSSSGEPQGEPGSQANAGQQPQSQGGAKEATPENPEARGQSDPQSQPGGSEPAGQEPQGQPPGGQEPRDPGEAPEQDPANQPGGAPPSADTERLSVREDAERWGDLPVHVREKFRSEGGGDLPPHYREWIESYYRRLNRAADPRR